MQPRKSESPKPLRMQMGKELKYGYDSANRNVSLVDRRCLFNSREVLKFKEELKMKIVNYRSEQPEVKELLEATFGKVEVEAFVTEESVRFEKELVLEYSITNNPLIVEGHEFELLRDITINIPELDVTSKSFTELPNPRKIAHIVLNYWISSKLGRKSTAGSRVSKNPEIRAKMQSEKDLLRQFLAKKLK